jgi:hypothetical protein
MGLREVRQHPALAIKLYHFVKDNPSEYPMSHEFIDVLDIQATVEGYRVSFGLSNQGESNAIVCIRTETLHKWQTQALAASSDD